MNLFLTSSKNSFIVARNVDNQEPRLAIANTKLYVPKQNIAAIKNMF